MAEAVARPVNTTRMTFQVLPDAKQEGEHYVVLPSGQKEGWVHAHSRQTILVEPQALYALWKDVTTIPLWQEHVVSVTPVSETVSHWTMGNPEDETGKRLEFDSTIVEDIPGKKLAWNSTGGEVEQHGQVEFAERRDGRGTVVTLTQHFKIGKLANAAAAVVKRSPAQTVIEDLRHFKELAETGEIPSVRGQAHGPRGMSGGIKEWLYGETNPTPPGTSREPDR